MRAPARPSAVTLRHDFEPTDNTRLAHLCGAFDQHLRSIEAALSVQIGRRGAVFRVDGGPDPARRALALLQSLYAQAARPIPAETLQLALVEARAMIDPTESTRALPPGADAIVLHTRRADLRGRTPTQVQYLHNILGHDITFGIGPAGTGKTFLAVACAVDALERSSVQRIGGDRPGRTGVQRLQQGQRARGLGARPLYPEGRLAPVDAHRQGGLDGAQMRVEGAAQVGQTGVVGGLEDVAQDHR